VDLGMNVGTECTQVGDFLTVAIFFEEIYKSVTVFDHLRISTSLV